MITFEEWDVKSDFRVFSIKKNNFHVAKLLLDERNQFNSVLTFDSRKVFTTDDLAEIGKMVCVTFGDIEFKIGG